MTAGRLYNVHCRMYQMTDKVEQRTEQKHFSHHHPHSCSVWPTSLNSYSRLTYFDNLKCIVSFMLKHRFTDDKKTLIVIVNTAASHISCRFCVVLASQSVQYFLSRGSDAVFSFRGRFLPCLLSYLPYYSLLFCCYSDTNRSRQARIQDFLTGGVGCRGVPPFSLPFPLFPPLPFYSPPHPFPLPPFP